MKIWKEYGSFLPDALAKKIGSDWLDILMTPNLNTENTNPENFAKAHFNAIQLKVQEEFGALQTNQEFHKASVLIMGIALHLARSIGANPEALAQLWCETAKSYGAKDC